MKTIFILSVLIGFTSYGWWHEYNTSPKIGEVFMDCNSRAENLTFKNTSLHIYTKGLTSDCLVRLQKALETNTFIHSPFK